MAFSALKTQAEKKQFFDSEEVLDEKVTKLADLILKSKHFIAFTGAGISTASGIPDYRSGTNTVLKTGPGTWEKKAQNVKKQHNPNIVGMAAAVPSFSHMALVALEQAGLLKFLVSQNVDGLHVRSGFDTDKLTEMHGNRCLEYCKDCGSRFLRDFKARDNPKIHSHYTSRRCEKCKGTLYDTIINFGENLNSYEFEKSFEEAGKADLCLAMGSSLTVPPAAHVPEQVSKHGKLVIVNIQRTPLDRSRCHLKINALCDDVMKRLVDKLKIKVNDFLLRRIIQFKIRDDTGKMEIRGVDIKGNPFTFFKSLQIQYPGQSERQKLEGEPYKIPLERVKGANLYMEFYGYYDEADMEMELDLDCNGNFLLQYDPKKQEWVNQDWIELQTSSEQKELKK